ncbi:MAG TPA: orotate phosphoribosyltransferase [Flavobacteriales bacterium]|jgi:orotate phosphoribosyltransferase|nr:orotate phosphoribosyltransferase [Flavobacteriales bacterium]|tara:strand:+ start:942 stop:1598 length:657 start_codon:yes stop_codon:yes gene_type:complete
MVLSVESRRKVAEFLLRIKAIQLSPNEPFTWASGRKSPIYCDNRKVLSHPAVRTFVRQLTVEAIEKEYGKVDAIAGVATGGIALGALVAQELGLPFIYVRSKAKAHGLGNAIEGDLSVLSNVVVIEDLISTGQSSLKAVDALREAGVEVKGLIAIFTYGLPVAQAAFEASPCKWLTLTDYPTMLDQALVEGYLNDDQRSLLDAWNSDPVAWSDAFESK